MAALSSTSTSNGIVMASVVPMATIAVAIADPVSSTTHNNRASVMDDTSSLPTTTLISSPRSPTNASQWIATPYWDHLSSSYAARFPSSVDATNHSTNIVNNGGINTTNGVPSLSSSPPSSLLFRPLARHDIPELRQLQDVLFPVKYDDNFYEELFDDEVITCMAFIRQPNGSEGKMIGVATARYRDISGACSRVYDGYIITLGVSPESRKSGLGSFLLHTTVTMLQQSVTAPHAAARRRSCQSVHLHVKADNIAAVSMYTKAGFITAEYLRDHYRFDGRLHDALHLSLPLSKRSKSSTKHDASSSYLPSCVIL